MGKVLVRGGCLASTYPETDSPLPCCPRGDGQPSGHAPAAMQWRAGGHPHLQEGLPQQNSLWGLPPEVGKGSQGWAALLGGAYGRPAILKAEQTHTHPERK